MSLLQNICDAIWTAETRALLEGTPLASPANLLEEICDACWTETTRELTSEPLALPDYPDVENESPFEQDEAIVTVAATGGSAPISYSLTAQSTTAGMLKVTGALTPDATGIYVENGTPTVAAYEPFTINASTGEITIADASGLAVGQVWTLTVRATDALLDTDDGTVTVELTAAAGGVFVRRINQHSLATGSYGAAQVQV